MIKPFESAEQAIQWHFNCVQHRQNGGVNRRIYAFERPCEAIEISLIAAKLLRDKKITAGQYLIFSRLANGSIEWVPDSLLPKWNDFVAKMDKELKGKHIVDDGRHYV